MKTVIIKNLSSIWDESAVSMCQLDLTARNHDRNYQPYKKLFAEDKKRYGVNVKIEESEVDNKITYTVTDAECDGAEIQNTNPSVGDADSGRQWVDPETGEVWDYLE